MRNDQAALGQALEAYGPAEITARVETAGVAKARMGVLQTLTLAVLAGAFIAFGGMFYLVALTGADLSLGITRIFAGMAFSLGLVLVLVAGAELFTGNNLIVIAWADGLISSVQLLRNWALVYVGNFVGATGMVALALLAGLPDHAGGGLGAVAASVAEAKVALSPLRAFFSGILCNILVCLAVWMCFSAQQIAAKVVCIVFPITAFVALGFEHSIANMFLITFGLMAAGQGLGFDLAGLIGNLIPVTLGNIVGGSGLVALVYWLIYRRGPATRRRSDT
jgi:formate/nitrite transporter